MALSLAIEISVGVALAATANANAGVALLPQTTAHWQDAQGESHTWAEFETHYLSHQRWLDTSQREGARLRLPGGYFNSSDLRNAQLQQAMLARATFDDSSLQGAKFLGATLSGARFERAQLAQADLMGADLTKANFMRADLTNASLEGAILDYADFAEADLKGARFSLASVTGAVFEPRTLPNTRSFASVKGLPSLTYRTSPDALVQLRKEFQDGGFRDQERQITYAIQRRANIRNLEQCSLNDSFKACMAFGFNLAMFDWTSRYGMDPARPVELIFALWVIGAVAYFIFMHSSGQSGLLRIDAADHWNDTKPVVARKIVPTPIWGARERASLVQAQFLQELSLLGTAMFFSLMSAFNIGFRDVNFGRWLKLLTRQEFDIKAFGWARVFSGWQSLISVYLFALWLLTYFGRPFQ